MFRHVLFMGHIVIKPYSMRCDAKGKNDKTVPKYLHIFVTYDIYHDDIMLH